MHGYIPMHYYTHDNYMYVHVYNIMHVILLHVLITYIQLHYADEAQQGRNYLTIMAGGP